METINKMKLTEKQFRNKLLNIIKKELNKEDLEQFTDFEIINNDFGVVEISCYDVLNNCKNQMKFTFNFFR